MEEHPFSRKKVALIYSYGANEGDKDLHVQDGFLDEENSDDTKGLNTSQRDFLDNAIKDYNHMFNTNYSTSGEGFQNYTAVNGQEATDWQQSLRNGDQIEYSDGKDRMEDYTSNDTDIKSKSKIEGVGAIHKFEGNGENGT